MPIASAESVFGHDSENNPFVFVDPDGESWVVKTGTGTEETEVEVYEIARDMFGGIVPETQLVHMRGVVMSAQKYVDGVVANDLGVQLFPAVRNDEAMMDLANLVLMDYLLENSDRHSNNWLVTGGRVVAIDNGKAFGGPVLFQKALRVAQRCLLVDDCNATPSLIEAFNAVLSSLPSEAPTPRADRWQEKIRHATHLVGVWTMELERMCRISL